MISLQQFTVIFQYFLCVKGANEHDVIVYMVIKDMLNECGQPHHNFQKFPFLSIYTEMQPRNFQTKRGLQHFQKAFFFLDVLRFTTWKSAQTW